MHADLDCCMQGVYSPTTFAMLQLPKEWYNALEWQYPPHQVQALYYRYMQ